jgi:alanyl-tRNA synthetase
MSLGILDIREDFIKYFRSKRHRMCPPSKVFIEEDDSLMFTNAGMNQFKDRILSGIDSERTDETDKSKRLCNSQICIRAGGKHNDLDDVGDDSYHLTSFEMLGNWSMNNYQKKETITFAFEYLTQRLGLDLNRIYVTYFEGSEEKGLEPDLETKAIWESMVDPSRVLPGSFGDNFWMMGDTGPCGACTEIHYDISKETRFCPELVNADDPEVIEIWNNVFMEMVCEEIKDNNESESRFEYRKMGDRFYVDTGMGLERLAMVVQNKPTVYQTDAFHFLFGYARALCNVEHSYSDTYHYSKSGQPDADADKDVVLRDRAYRIFADHFRTTVIALYDGAEFDISGRGNVLRKIFRRLLTNTYLYLNNYTVQPLMSHPIIGAIISSILNYHLKRMHNREELQKMLIAEENIYLGILWNSKKRVDSSLKKIQKIENMETSSNGNSHDSRRPSPEQMKEKLYASLKKTGMPKRIVENIDRITINRKDI